MPSRTITYDNLNTSSMAAMETKLRDTFFKDNLLLLKLRGENKTFSGGTYLTEPIITGGLTASYSSDYDVLTPQDVQTDTTAQYEIAEIKCDVSISDTEALKNSGEGKIYDLLKAKLINLKSSMLKKMSTEVFSANTTGTQVVGLRTAVNTTATTGTYAGIDRAGGAYWQNKTKDFTALANISLPGMNALFMDTLDGTAKKPDIAVTTQAIWNEVWTLMEAKGRRPEDGREAYAGFNAINFNSTPMIVDASCAAGFLYFLNSEFIYLKSHVNSNLSTSPWMRPTDQDVQTKRMRWMGQLVCSNLRHQGVGYNLS